MVMVRVVAGKVALSFRGLWKYPGPYWRLLHHGRSFLVSAWTLPSGGCPP
jgi:hypothetical protein